MTLVTALLLALGFLLVVSALEDVAIGKTTANILAGAPLIPDARPDSGEGPEGTAPPGGDAGSGGQIRTDGVGSPMSFDGLRELALRAGFDGKNATIAAAVALAESGGYVGAYNPETRANAPTGSGSRGLWQIFGAAHPEFDSDAFYDPVRNALAAFAVWHAAGQRWTPWSAYTNGSYRKFLA